MATNLKVDPFPDDDSFVSHYIRLRRGQREAKVSTGVDRRPLPKRNAVADEPARTYLIQHPEWTTLCVREFLREYALRDRGPGIRWDGIEKVEIAADIAEAVQSVPNLETLQDAVDEAKGMRGYGLIPVRGLTFVAAASILLTPDSPQALEVIENTPDYARLFVHECLQLCGPSASLPMPADAPLPFRRLASPELDCEQLARSVAALYDLRYAESHLSEDVNRRLKEMPTSVATAESSTTELPQADTMAGIPRGDGLVPLASAERTAIRTFGGSKLEHVNDIDIVEDGTRLVAGGSVGLHCWNTESGESAVGFPQLETRVVTSLHAVDGGRLQNQFQGSLLTPRGLKRVRGRN